MTQYVTLRMYPMRCCRVESSVYGHVYLPVEISYRIRSRQIPYGSQDHIRLGITTYAVLRPFHGSPDWLCFGHAKGLCKVFGVSKAHLLNRRRSEMRALRNYAWRKSKLVKIETGTVDLLFI